MWGVRKISRHVAKSRSALAIFDEGREDTVRAVLGVRAERIGEFIELTAHRERLVDLDLLVPHRVECALLHGRRAPKGLRRRAPSPLARQPERRDVTLAGGDLRGLLSPCLPSCASCRGPENGTPVRGEWGRLEKTALQRAPAFIIRALCGRCASQFVDSFFGLVFH